VRRVLLDSNALDPLITQGGAYDVLLEAVSSGKLEIAYTHVTVDENTMTPDKEKREKLLGMLESLGQQIRTSGAVWGDATWAPSRWDQGHWMPEGDVDTFDALRSGKRRHTEDALISHTALREGYALVTNERRLTNRAKDEGIEVLTTAELLAEFGYTRPLEDRRPAFKPSLSRSPESCCPSPEQDVLYTTHSRSGTVSGRDRVGDRQLFDPSFAHARWMALDRDPAHCAGRAPGHRRGDCAVV
jgi:rRNA-processing protein FCF1